MGCTKSLSLNQASTGDMGLDAAIYEPTTQKVFGVRGQWLFQFSSVTGNLEQSLRFTTNAISDTSLTAMGGKLYIGTWNIPIEPWNASPPVPRGDVFIVSAAGFTVSGQFNLFSTLGFGYNHAFGVKGQMANNGTVVACADVESATWPTNTLFSVDPTNVAAANHFNGGKIEAVEWDSVNSVFWFTDSASPDIYAASADFVSSCFDTGVVPVFGITYNSAQNKVYAATGGESIIMVSAAGHFPAFSNFPTNTLHTGRINCNAFRIRSVNNQVGNPHNGKVLIPTWADDAVVIWNPATDTVDSVLTGFTAPIDVVVCPTTNWAVQSGTVGLKAIT